MLSDAQRMFAMYVIGEVESNWDWTAINYNDPITLGMMQWYGTRAASLLERVKSDDAEGYTLLASSLTSSLDSHPSSDSWWTTRYLTRDEGNSWITCAQRDENHEIQQAQFFEDLQGYEQLFASWGLPDENVKQIIFIACMYHQSPRQAGHVVTSAGANASLELLYTTCLNDSVLGNYRNRYNTAYNRLTAWDGESSPPDFGQVDDPDTQPGGDAGVSVVEQQNLFTHARVLGDVLTVYGRDQYESGIIFQHFGGGLYKPAVNKTGTPEQGGNTGAGDVQPSDPGASEKVMQWVYDRENRFAYAQSPGRLTPDISGITDCSGMVWSAYHYTVGIDVASSTQAILDQGRNQGKVIAQGGTSDRLPVSSMSTADIVVMDLIGYAGNWPETDHVELYDGNNGLWGQRGGYGPNKWAIPADQLHTHCNRWWVIRYL